MRPNHPRFSSPLFVAAAAVVIAGALASSPASAQPPKPAPAPAPAPAPTPAPSSSSNDTALNEAKARFEEGLKFADAGDNENARLKFSQAWVLFKSPAVLFNLARAEQLSGHTLEALDHYRQFARLSADPKITDAQRQKASENVTELSKKVGQIDIEAPANTRVTIDGHPVDNIADPIPVQPGKHIVEATIDGKPKSVSVDCAAGTIAKAKLGDPNAGSSGSSGHDPGGSPPEMEEERSTMGYVVPIALGVVGIGGLVMGGVFASSSQSAKDDAESIRRGTPGLCADPPSAACGDYDSKRDDAESKATLAWVGYATGGVFLVASAATFLFWPKSKASSPTRGMKLTPQFGAQGGGARLDVTF